MPDYYLGLISGTSVDGVDAALCAFGERSCQVVTARTYAYPPRIRERVQQLIRTGESSLAAIGAIDVAVGRFFADCALAAIREAGLTAGDIAAIGHHGQTIWHEPNLPEPFTWQIGDPNSIAAITGIDTVADLRRLDMALGGQGAPLVPAFHAWLLSSDTQARVILNIGGIANITLLAPGRDTLGFDTGPGNTLLDLWVSRERNLPYDDGGHWAAGGEVDRSLLERLLDDPYFSRRTPKSTGREYFNEAWLERKLAAPNEQVASVNVAATLLELTAQTIADAIGGLGLSDYAIIACGGGVRNAALMARIGKLTRVDPTTTADFGIDPDHVEAAAMAWLARARLAGEPGNLPTVTAARQPVTLGALYSGAKSGA
jgi:anhydro-N-acetylmuramic acid kinase